MSFIHFVYILYSSCRQKYYIGYTADLADRLSKHTSKHKGFTNGVKDWQIIYTENFGYKFYILLPAEFLILLIVEIDTTQRFIFYKLIEKVVNLRYK